MNKPLYIVAGQSNAGSLRASPLFRDLAQAPDAILLGFSGDGTALAQVDGDDWNVQSGELLAGMIDGIAAAIASGGHIAGFIWVQGEADAQGRRGENYCRDLEDMLETLRDTFGDFRTAIVALSAQAPVIDERRDFRRDWLDVRADQFEAAGRVENTVIVDPDAVAVRYGLPDSEMFRDTKHYELNFASILMREALAYVDPQNALGDRGVAHGTNIGDVLRGSLMSDTIFGLSGDDVIVGNRGHDLLIGGGGKDKIYGQVGNDTIVGGAGDTITGGSGTDVFVFKKGFGRATVIDFETKDTFALHGYAGETWSVRQSGHNTFITLDGDQILILKTKAHTINTSDFDF